MKHIRSSLLLAAFVGVWCLPAAQAQENQPTMLILSKDAGGRILGASLALTLRANPTCDQTGEAFPDGSQLIATDLTFLTDDNNLGLVYGSVQINGPDGQGLQTMMMRGTFGMNTRRDAEKNCRFEHLEAVLEPVPTFAPVNAPQIAMAHLSADIIPEAAGPLPLYRAKLDGVVTLPKNMNANITINPDKNAYGETESIKVAIANNTNQAITTYDLKSYCSIVRLQRQDGEQWEDIGRCLLKRRSFPVTINAGETIHVVLPQDGNADAMKKPGAYRLVLDYLVGAGAETTSEGRQIVSPTFQVNQATTNPGVKLQLDRLIETVGQAFVAQLINDTDLPIQIEDHKSECTVLNVQRQSGADWVNVAECRSLRPTRLIKIEPKQRQAIKLQGDGVSYPAGTYRLEANYQALDSNGQPQGTATLLYSAPFTLQERK